MESLGKTSEWVTRPLIEVATLQRGYDLPIQDRTGGLHPIFAANGTVGFHGSSKCKGPGVVTGRSGTIGKVHFVKTDFWPLNTSLYVKNFHGNDPRWVYYMLQSFGLESYSQGAGVPTLNRNLVHGEPVKVPPLPEQRRIAAILDQAETLRTQRRTALSLLDTLTQSIFLDMFGDPVTNDRSWPSARIVDFVADFESGKSLVADDEDDSTSQFRVLKVSAVTSLEYKPEQSKAVPSDYNPPESHIVRAGDLLFSRANTTELIGATALVNQTPDNLLLPDKLWRFVWHKTPRTEPLYVRHLFQQPKFRQEIGQRASGTSGSMKNITQDKVLSIQVGHPPLPFQQTFATRIAAIEALKSTHRAALAQLDALFASLQHRAFSGELTRSAVATVQASPTAAVRSFNDMLQLDPEKGLEALIYVGKRTPKQDLYKALKTVYLADRHHLEHHGCFIYGETYNALPMGPVPQAAYEATKRLNQRVMFSPFDDDQLHAALRCNGDKLITLREADFSKLSETERKSLDRAISYFADMSFEQVKTASHDSAYDKTPANAPIAMQDLIASLPQKAQQQFFGGHN